MLSLKHRIGGILLTTNQSSTAADGEIAEVSAIRVCVGGMRKCLAGKHSQAYSCIPSFSLKSSVTVWRLGL